MSNSIWPSDFEALARQYWSSWNEMMRQAARQTGASPTAFAGMPGFAAPGFSSAPFAATPGVMPGVTAWQDMLGQWARMAQGFAAPQPPSLADTLNETLARMQSQAGDWYGRMQQLAAQVAGQNASAAEIAQQWKSLLTQSGEGAWLELFRTLQPPEPNGFDAWYSQVQPMLNGWLGEARSWLGMPTIGIGREHQERLQNLARAQLDYQEKLAAHNAALLKNAQQAFENFEKKLAEHESPGSEITSARALFDLWIDAAEDAFAQMALSRDYREVYGQMVNAQMRLRQDVQKEIENLSGQLGMPTRTEMEAAHRKIAELERALRRSQRQNESRKEEGAERRVPAASAVRTSKRPDAKKAKPTEKPASPREISRKTAAPAKKAAARKTVKRSR